MKFLNIKLGEISLQKSLKEFPKPYYGATNKSWENWAEKLREIMIKERNIGHDWDFSKEQINCMSDYLYANKLILDCLNCGSYATKSVREEIMDTLLVPSGC